MKENQLPKYFVVKRDDANPLWRKYIQWLNTTYKVDWGPYNFLYWGYDGNSNNYGNGTRAGYDLGHFQNSPVLLTLDEWDAIVNQKELKVGDKVELHGFEYVVKVGVLEQYYLSCIGDLNYQIFIKLGIDNVSQFTKEVLGYDFVGGFLYCKTLADLTKLVNALKNYKPTDTAMTENKAKQKLTYGGQIADFPVEVVEKMLERQVEQGNKRDVWVFENYRGEGKLSGGFIWGDTDEGLDFWEKVICYKNFDAFFKKYPKQTNTMTEKTYEVTREQMGKIHEIACESWKTKINSLVDRSFGKYDAKANLSHSEVKEMMAAATDKQKPVLKEIFPTYSEQVVIPKGEWAWVRVSEDDEWLCRCSSGDGMFYSNQKTSGLTAIWKFVVPYNQRPF